MHFLVYNDIMRSFFIALILCFAFPMTSWSTNYYLSSNQGSNTNSGLSELAPWKDLSKVHWMQLAPGDTIFLHKNSSFIGPFFIISAGTKSSPIVITHYGEGELPIIRNTGNWSNGIEIRGDHGANHVIVDGIAFTESQEGGVNVRHNAKHVIIRNCKFYKQGFGVVLQGDSNLVEHNEFYDLIMVRNTQGNIGTVEADDDYGAVGVQIEGSHNTVQHNSFKRLRAPSFDYNTDGGAVEFYGNADSNWVFANKVEFCNGFFEVGGGTAIDNRVAFNLVIDNFISTAFFHLSGTFKSQVERFYFEHNTIVFRNPVDHAYVLGFNGVPQAEYVYFRNNIVVSAVPLSHIQGFTHSHNLFSSVNNSLWGVDFAVGEFANQIHFVDSAKGDYRLANSSYAINKGMVLNYQFDYNLTPLKSSVDLGAFQYIVTSSIKGRNYLIPLQVKTHLYDLLGRRKFNAN